MPRNYEPCLYQIKNLLNTKVYIGSTVDRYRRFVQHRYLLNANKHHCRHLQLAWNKYGADSFEFSIIKDCSLDDRLQDETELLKSHDRKLLYNTALDARSPQLGVPRSIETKTKIGIASKERVRKPFSSEVRNKMRLSHKCHAIERICKLTGEVKEYISISSVKTDGYNYPTIYKVCKGKRKSAYGFYWQYLGGDFYPTKL